jgi:hypothetical protein
MTSSAKLKSSDHRMYIAFENGVAPCGFLRMGVKHLYYYVITPPPPAILSFLFIFFAFYFFIFLYGSHECFVYNHPLEQERELFGDRSLVCVGFLCFRRISKKRNRENVGEQHVGSMYQSMHFICSALASLKLFLNLL